MSRVAYGIAHPNAEIAEIEQRLATMRAALPAGVEVRLEVRVPLPVDSDARAWWGDSMLRFAMRVTR